MQKRQILFNAISSVIQIVLVGITLFILYKYLLATIGVAQLGIWSLVFATTSIAQLSNFGISGSIVKYVAKYNAIGRHDSLSLLIQTGTTSVASFFIIIALILYPIVKIYLGFALHGNSYDYALSILPHALVAFWIMMITSIFQAGIYGLQLVVHRNLILVGESISFLFICFLFAPKYGLIGMAYARIIQNVITLVVTWLVLKQHIPKLPFFFFRWNKSIFKEIISYSVNFQIISILAILCDPLTKGLLSRFGSVAMVGYYEMANRMVQQVRSLIVNANQVLVPVFSNIKEIEPEKIQSLYLKSYNLLYFVSLPIFSFLVISTPFVSNIWIGRFNIYFVNMAIILSLGWFLNTLCAPAYYANLGIGDMKWNVISHLIMGLLNVIIGFFAGIYFGGIGVVVGWAIAIVVGGFIVSISYHRVNKLSLAYYFPESSRFLTLTCIFGIVGSFILFYWTEYLKFQNIKSGIIIPCFLIVVAVPILIHPMRKEITGWVKIMLGK